MYSIKKISFNEAKIVWKHSPNANAYNNPDFLKNFRNISFFAVSKGRNFLLLAFTS